MDNLTLGILGGGQLGRMTALSAAHLGVTVRFLDPSPVTDVVPAGVCAERVVGAYAKDALANVEALASTVDVVTIEIEHVDAEALLQVQATKGTKIHPDPSTVKLIQDKYEQKRHFRAMGVPLGRFADVPDAAALEAACAAFNFPEQPLMLKRKRLAYDGKGNFLCRTKEDLEKGVAALGGFGAVALYAEEFVAFDREIAVMVLRSADKGVVAYPVTETIHRDNICHVTETPAADLTSEQRVEAMRVALQAIDGLKGYGVFGVEMFLLQSGSGIYLNEVAPRPHNSGHYTQNACVTSQFENHVRAVLEMPLGDVSMNCASSVMLNVLGEEDGEAGLAKARATMKAALETPGATVHWYGKTGCRKGRKMGHINIVGTSREEVRDRLKRIDAGAWASLVRAKPPSPLVGIIMGSDSDLKTMVQAAKVLEDDFKIPIEVTVVSAHRTPDRLVEYARTAHERGLRVIIAGAGGAAHLPGMVASMTPLPVIGVPVTPDGCHFDGLDALLSIVQMPKGVPVATVAVGNAANAGLLAARILGTTTVDVREKMLAFQERTKQEVVKKAEMLESRGWRDYAKA